VGSTIVLRIERAEAITSRVRRLVLVATDGAQLESFAPGSHIELHVPASGSRPLMHRAYSLVRPHTTGNAYEIAVQLEGQGTGGSRWVHELSVGQTVAASSPRNDFPMRGMDSRPLLIAAGIGITPILCMALDLQRQGKQFDLHYVAREPSDAAYADEVRALPNAHCWFDGGDPSKGIPLRKAIGASQSGRHLHVCGPKGFIAATLDAGRELGWSEDHLHCELFTGSLPVGGDRPFVVELRQTGMTVDVVAGQSIMEAMEAAGIDTMFDCRRGDCGICTAQVIEGQAEHRDSCLSSREREAGSICICVSRSMSEKLVLDL